MDSRDLAFTTMREEHLVRLVAFTPAVVVHIEGALRGCAQSHVRQSVKLILARLRRQNDPDRYAALRLVESAFAVFSAAHAHRRSLGMA